MDLGSRYGAQASAVRSRSPGARCLAPGCAAWCPGLQHSLYSFRRHRLPHWLRRGLLCACPAASGLRLHADGGGAEQRAGFGLRIGIATARQSISENTAPFGITVRADRSANAIDAPRDLRERWPATARQDLGCGAQSRCRCGRFQFQPAQVNGDPAAGSSHSRHAEMLVLSDHDQLEGTTQ
jgi:hypothetical protein